MECSLLDVHWAANMALSILRSQILRKHPRFLNACDHWHMLCFCFGAAKQKAGVHGPAGYSCLAAGASLTSTETAEGLSFWAIIVHFVVQSVACNMARCFRRSRRNPEMRTALKYVHAGCSPPISRPCVTINAMANIWPNLPAIYPA